ncbi:hypothetical protein AG1IA_04736 [Rhizoctonia solani AG-1 IA]|uniref:Uncharacterized protein n=1 Tax=Thanatephorus cucumeris (strain AG1-IA) TaxID=983506 RepID=L8WXZ9_THACA|nr:hypothetical protein AG1IA_04736 [Rhizoctonia solani AG-1 IA]
MEVCISAGKWTDARRRAADEYVVHDILINNIVDELVDPLDFGLTYRVLLSMYRDRMMLTPPVFVCISPPQE